MTIIEAVSAPDAKGTTNQAVRGSGAFISSIAGVRSESGGGAC